MSPWRPVLWLLHRLPARTRSNIIYDADDYMPPWLYDRYDRFGSRLMTAYHRDISTRAKGCSACGAPVRLAGRRGGGGFLTRCDNGHEGASTNNAR